MSAKQWEIEFLQLPKVANSRLDSPFGIFHSARWTPDIVLCYVLSCTPLPCRVLSLCVCCVDCGRAVCVLCVWRGLGWALVASVGQQEGLERARR